MHYFAAIVMSLLCLLGWWIDLDFSLRSDFYPESEHVFLVFVALAIIYWLYSARFADWSKYNHLPVGFPDGPTSQFTTRVRYHLFVLAYASLGVATLFIVYGTPQGALGLLCAVPELSLPVCKEGFENVGRWSLSSLSLGLAVAIALLGVPLIEERWRSALQRSADIPSRATNLFMMLLQKFEVFAPSKEIVDAFLEHYNDGKGPPLFRGDIYTKRDEGYLETYPRIAIILYRLSRFDAEKRRMFDYARFSSGLDKLYEQFHSIRSDIAGLHQTLDKTLGKRFAGDFSSFHYTQPANEDADADQYNSNSKIDAARLREQFGEDFGDRSRGEYAITRIDNILHNVKNVDEGFSDSDEELRRFMLGRLKEISARSTDLYYDVLKIIVLMSLRSTASPRVLLEYLGFRLERGETDQTEIAPWLVIISFALSFLITGIFYFVSPSSVWIVFVFSLCMLSACFLSGFVVANMILGATLSSRRNQTPKLTISDNVMLFVFPLISTLFSLVILQKFYPNEAMAALWYAPVAACYGTYVASTVVKEAKFRDKMVKQTEHVSLPDRPKTPREHVRETNDRLAPLRNDGIVYCKDHFRRLATVSCVFATLAMLASSTPMPDPFLITLAIAAFLVPATLVGLIWLLDRDRIRRSYDEEDRHEQRHIKLWLQDAMFLVLVSPVVLLHILKRVVLPARRARRDKAPAE
ncbi:MAG: hypothetical protein R8G34_07795 [Paracoccaceae bacterium]|nr:hypothetical protein [Paracoccaceae bacterium]